MPAFWISSPTGACDADMDTVDGADAPMLVVAPMIAVTAGRADRSTVVVADVREINPIENGADARSGS